MQPCDFFREVPSGCRAYVMKHVIHDWDDERARNILANCRRAVPEDGALLLVEWALPEGNAPSAGKFADVMMMLMTGGELFLLPAFANLLKTDAGSKGCFRSARKSLNWQRRNSGLLLVGILQSANHSTNFITRPS